MYLLEYKNLMLGQCTSSTILYYFDGDAIQMELLYLSFKQVVL